MGLHAIFQVSGDAISDIRKDPEGFVKSLEEAFDRMASGALGDDSVKPEIRADGGWAGFGITVLDKDSNAMIAWAGCAANFHVRLDAASHGDFHYGSDLKDQGPGQS